MGLKLVGRKPKSGEGEGEGAGENGDWLDTGEKEGVPERELPSDTSMLAASHSSKSKRDRSCESMDWISRRGRESPPRLLASLLSREVSSQSNSLLARPPLNRRSEGVIVPELLAPPLSRSAPPSISLVRIDRWREQYPRRCDSFMQPSREHSRLHCFPLNFLRMPLGVHTTSPFLYFCCAAVSGVREREEDAEEEVEPEPPPGVLPPPGVGILSRPPRELRAEEEEELEEGGSGGRWCASRGISPGLSGPCSKEEGG